METTEKSFLDNITGAIRGSVTLKLIAIFFLMLILMIPMAFIESLIAEREAMRQSAIKEVSDKWANEQRVYGPVLTIPFNRETVEDGRKKLIREEAHILPSQLSVNGEINPQTLHRGIYEVVVYDARLSFSGTFSGSENYLSDIKKSEILWDEAFLTINISDLRGIKDKISFNLNGTVLPVEPGTKIPEIVPSGITVNNVFKNTVELKDLSFSFELYLQGSRHLGFVPIGKETDIKLASGWRDPSFSGAFLPDKRQVGETGFTAEYKILELNRNYPQFWIGAQNTSTLMTSAFGVDLLLRMNDYQKSTRSAKYALLAISLTFLTFFLVEIFNRKKVHPFQYILIGLALVLYYALLISISEHTNFDIAYAAASISIIAIIGLYSKTILNNKKQALLLVLILAFTYIFVYITLQLQDYALLFGSIGLTVILAATMFITRKINWYDLGSAKQDESD